MAANTSQNVTFYGRVLLFIAGMGGLLYGIIAAAVLYLEKTINLTVEQSSFNLAAGMGGSMFSSLVADAQSGTNALPCSLLGGLAQFVEPWMGQSLRSRL